MATIQEINRQQAANLLVLTSESIVYIMIAEVNNNTKAIIIQSGSLTYWLELKISEKGSGGSHKPGTLRLKR